VLRAVRATNLMDAISVSNAYAERLASLRRALADLDRRSSRISTLRGVTFLIALGLFGVRAFRPVPTSVWIVAGAATAAFAGLVVAHAVLVTRMGELELRVRLVERGPRRIAGDLADLPARGDRFAAGSHAYAGDLDVFGRASLFQLVSAAETGPGEARLASWLAAPADAAEVAARQEAARELAGLTAFREELAVAGAQSGTAGREGDPVLAWAERAGERAAPSPLLVRAGKALPVVTIAAYALPRVLLGDDASSSLRLLWLLPFFVQLALLLAMRGWTEGVLQVASSREAPFGRFLSLFRAIEGQAFTSPRLAALRAELVPPDGERASEAIAALERRVGFAELRHNALIYVPVNLIVLWDVFCADALDGWRARAGTRVRRWIEVVAEVEALASLATFAYEHPDFAFPDVSGGPLHLEAEALGHPLIAPGRRVANDVALRAADAAAEGEGAALVITGSNMSGKSTLLRAIGVNAVLALAGAPVCARRLALATAEVRTSMRIKDSLEEGVSHFYAELERLKAIVDAADAGGRVLFLLDEVLHGTNSRERRIGAKAVVTHLLGKGAIGAVSSHDLGLADLEREARGRVKNVHFEELVEGGKMTFDYKLKPGVVTSSNALRLMRLVGIRVELPEE
jgi:hypothetical protein